MAYNWPSQVPAPPAKPPANVLTFTIYPWESLNEARLRHAHNRQRRLDYYRAYNRWVALHGSDYSSTFYAPNGDNNFSHPARDTGGASE
jgi:hypothetical protein